MFVASMFELTQYSFMQNAFMAGTVIAVLAGVIGYFVVLKQLGFTSHALSHIGFAGACGAGLLGLSLMSGQLLLTLIAALLMAFFGDRVQKNDAAIGIILAFSLGLGSLFLYSYDHYAGSASRILFGDLLSVTTQSLHQMEILSLLCILIIALIARPLWFSALLPELALARGLPVRILQYTFFALLAVAITLTSQAVGILMIFTLLIGPPAVAVRCSQSFWSGVLLSILFNLIAIWLALVLSAATNWPLSFWVSAIVLLGYIVASSLQALRP
jgi:zinc/manganese transport system permease protein